MIHIYSVLKFLLGNLNASLKVTYHIQVPLLCVMLNMEPKTRVPHATTKHLWRLARAKGFRKSFLPVTERNRFIILIIIWF